MKTTELYVEQVLIGAMALFALVLPWSPEMRMLVQYPKSMALILGGALVLGVSFLLGILFDRFADTLTEPLENHQRIRFTWNLIYKKYHCKFHGRESNADIGGETFDMLYGENDPFPEDTIRYKSLSRSDGIVSWLDYHRSRVRLARAMAIYIPWITVAGVIGIARLSPTLACGNGWAYASVLMFLPYCGAAWWNALRKSKAKLNPRDSNYLTQAPRTDNQEGAVAYVKLHRVYSDPMLNPSADEKLIFASLSHVLRRDPTTLAVLLLLLVATCAGISVGISQGSTGTLLMVIFGIVGTTMAAWSWWRIGNTFRTYLDLVDSLPKA